MTRRTRWGLAPHRVMFYVNNAEDNMMTHAQRLARQYKFLTTPRAALIRRWHHAIRAAISG
jgi:hypothetical protein